MIHDIYERTYARADANFTFPSPGVIVDNAIDELVSRLDEEQLERVGDHLNILTTTMGVGLNARKPQNATNLKELLRQTSWIPYLTADGLYETDDEGVHIDGDFLTKLFPPPCTRSLSTPFMTHLNLIWHLFIPVRSLRMISNLIEAGDEFQSRHWVKSCRAPFCMRGLPSLSKFA